MRNLVRCQWAQSPSLDYIKYHDQEWGVPVYDDRVLFEFLILEGAQAGLSWSTILAKRDGYKKMFYDFDVQKIASISDKEIEAILQYPGIVRNRLKVNGTRTNAQKFMEIQEAFGSFSNYVWDFVDGKPIQSHWLTTKDVPVSTEISDKLSRDLKKRGFKFVGTTIMYAYMQAVGMVNDHTVDCFRYKQLQ